MHCHLIRNHTPTPMETMPQRDKGGSKAGGGGDSNVMFIKAGFIGNGGLIIVSSDGATGSDDGDSNVMFIKGFIGNGDGEGRGGEAGEGVGGREW